MKNKNLICWVLVFVIVFFCPLRASTDSEPSTRTYEYPYDEPMLATSTVALLRSQYPERVGSYVELAVLPSRGKVPQLEQYGRLGLLFYEQQGPAPLVVMIPGLGAYSLDNAPQWLAEQFFERGFHVIVLPSAFNWRFSVAASTTGRPGITRMDALDLTRVIHTALSYWQREIQQPIRRVGLVGYSLGALEAAFIAHEWNPAAMGSPLERILLINPPVDLRYGIARLDAFYQVRSRWSAAKAARLEKDLVGAALVYVQDHDIDETGYFKNLGKKFDFIREELEYGIGLGFRKALSRVIFTSQQVHDLGLLHAPVDPPRFVARLNEAKQFGFQDYYRRFLLPYTSEKTAASLFDNNSLGTIEDFLRDNDAIFLMHNQDDILLEAGDIHYLRGIFKDRAIIYPRGGHIGNLWFPENIEDIIAVFQPERENHRAQRLAKIP